jgi:hypothetical protein
MPARLSDTGKLARKHGLTYACVRYRLANGVPLDRPVQHGDNAKAWDTRGRTVADLARKHGLAWTTVKSRLQRGIPLDAPLMTKAETIALANKKRLEMIAEGTFKKRKYRTNPDSLERNMELRVKPTQPFNPWVRP